MKRIAFALPQKNSSESGNVIIFALITSVVVVVGLLGTATRSRYAERSIARDSLAKNALDAAEAGKDIILENLNSQHQKRSLWRFLHHRRYWHQETHFLRHQYKTWIH